MAQNDIMREGLKAILVREKSINLRMADVGSDRCLELIKHWKPHILLLGVQHPSQDLLIIVKTLLKSTPMLKILPVTSLQLPTSIGFLASSFPYDIHGAFDSALLRSKSILLLIFL